MAIIKTKKSEEILVNDDNLVVLTNYKWSISPQGYAQANHKVDGKYIKLLMHRLITNCPKGYVVDHLNENKLDNRIENLEIVTHDINIARHFVRKSLNLIKNNT